tara:strand:- start:8397 stop:8906 length:510 start_codon:yes stop_codon:yes gene_type:complete
MPETSDNSVKNFLTLLDQDRHEAFITYAEHTYSIYEIWLYAVVLGYESSFTSLEKWVNKRFPKLNRRELLLAETIKLESDIDYLRQQVQADLVKPDAAATRIAHLSKELRGHVVEVEKMSRGTDRRGLVLAGADKVMRELKSIFKGNEDVTNALELAYESVWADMMDEK